MRRVLICFWLLCFTSIAQAVVYDVRIDSLVATPANCGYDGSIKVYIGGADAGRMESVLYEAGGKTSSSPVIPDLAPGTYVVGVSGWIDGGVVELSGSATVGGTTSYIALDARIAGQRDAMPGMATGRVVLALAQGKLPYTVEVQEGGSVVATETFASAQAEYVVGDLPAGYYTLVVKDGCTTNYLSVWINTVDPPFECGKMQIYKGSTRKADVSLRLLEWYGTNDYYEEHRRGERTWWEYRLLFDGKQRADWTDIPADGVVEDAFPSQAYCDLWGKRYEVQVRVKGGNGEVVCTERLPVDKPEISDRNYVSLHESGCIKDTFITFNVSGSFYRPPLRMAVHNMSRGELLLDKEYVPDELIPIASDMFEDSIMCEFTDADGCVFSVRRKLGNSTDFDYWRGNYTSSFCNRNSVGVYFGHVYVEPESKPYAEFPPVGTVVELEEAPDTALCFRAEWDQDAETWTFIGNKPAEVMATDGSVWLNDPAIPYDETALPSGKYTFRVTDGCGYEMVFEKEIDFYRYENIEPLRVEGERLTCDGVEYFPQSKWERYRYTPGGFEPGEAMETVFTVSSFDGGTAEVQHNAVNGGSFIVDPRYNSSAQSFLVQEWYTYCLTGETRVDYRKPSAVDIKSVHGYRCQGGDAVITVVPDSTAGIQPYRFTLYEKQTGRLVDENTTGEFRVGGEGNEFRVKMTDDCHLSDAAYSEAERNITVLNIGVDRLISGRNTLCLGTKDSLRCRLQAGECEWTRPDGRVERQRQIYISCEEEEHLETGWYRMRIKGLECEAVDSILVSVARPYNDTIYLAPICDSELPFTHDEVTFYEEGFISKHNWTVNGCDSMTTYHLTVHPTYYEERKDTICASDLPYAYADTVFAVGTQTGSYTFHRKTMQGCDSTVVLDLLVGQLKDTAFHDTIFKYESFSKYNFNLPEQTEAGTFEHVQNLQTIYGCDSTVALTLTVLPVVKAHVTPNLTGMCGDETAFEISYEIYEGEAVSGTAQYSDNALTAGFSEINLTELTGKHTIPISLPQPALPDTYTLTFEFENEHGYIDRHVIEFAIVGNPAETALEATVFKYEDFSEYNFNLPEQTETGTFEHVQHLQTVAGCDSTVTLTLTVLPVVKAVIPNKYIEMCGDETGFAIEYGILEGEPEHCVVHFSDKAQQAGFNDFTDNAPDGASVAVPLPPFARPDNYSLTLSIEDVYGYADRHELSFTVLYPSSVVLQMWNDVLAVMNDEHNGGYTFSHYQWYKDGQPLRGETNSYLYVGPHAVLDTHAEYTVELTRADDGGAVRSCAVVPEVQHEVSAYPTLLHTSERMTVHAKVRGKVSIWTLSGMKLFEQHVEEGEHTLISPAQPGTYMLEMNFENGVRIKQMIVVR